MFCVELDEFDGVGSNHDDKNSVSGFTITKERKYFSNTPVQSVVSKSIQDLCPPEGMYDDLVVTLFP